MVDCRQRDLFRITEYHSFMSEVCAYAGDECSYNVWCGESDRVWWISCVTAAGGIRDSQVRRSVVLKTGL